MAAVEFRYGFPLFCSSCASDTLLKLDRNRVSDLWALLDYIIKQFVKYKNKDTKEFLLSLHEQAKYFYQAAESAPVKSQPLLYYYSFLNLAKVSLCITQGTSPDDEYYGIETSRVTPGAWTCLTSCGTPSTGGIRGMSGRDRGRRCRRGWKNC